MNRREFLRVSSGGAAVASTAGVAAGTSQAGPASRALQEGQPHTVNMTDSLNFEPAEITIAPGDTVEWTNVGSIAHSVTAYEDQIPDGADYFASGGFDSEQAARDGWPAGEGHIAGGETYSHTFETTGTYEYFCIPHETAGMVGTVEVAEGGGTGPGGGEELEPHEMGVPFQPHFVGLATILMMLVSLVFTFFVVKYAGSPHASSPNRRE